MKDNASSPAISDPLTEAAVRALRAAYTDAPLLFLEETTSTNTVAREAALGGAPGGTLVVAGRQTAGRGRRTHSFFSPADSGLYMSLLVRSALPAAEAIRLTTAAAVAVCRAAEAETGAACGIKWVNDIFSGGRKVCGILVESATRADGMLDWAVVGIGVNVSAPAGGFPPEIAGTAGALTAAPSPGLRARLLCAIEREFLALSADLAGGAYRAEYARRCLAVGHTVTVLAADGGEEEAFACGIDEECRLLVRYADGREAALSSGEIRIRLDGGR